MFPLLRLIIVVSYCICKIIHYTSIQYTQVWWKSRVSCYALQQQWPGYIAKSGRVRVVIIIIIHIFKKKFRVSCCCALQQWPGSIAESGRVSVVTTLWLSLLPWYYCKYIQKRKAEYFVAALWSSDQGLLQKVDGSGLTTGGFHHHRRHHHHHHHQCIIIIVVIIQIIQGCSSQYS